MIIEIKPVTTPSKSSGTSKNQKVQPEKNSITEKLRADIASVPASKSEDPMVVITLRVPKSIRDKLVHRKNWREEVRSFIVALFK